MYLEKLIIRNFRAIEELELNFNKGLNILIGENNSGKTAVIDALRISLGDFQQPRDIYCTKSDFRIDKSTITDDINDIQFDLIFKCEDRIETAWFNDLHAIDDNGNDNLQLHVKYSLIDFKSGKKVKRKLWGGEKEGGKVSYEVQSTLRNVYLSALRNTNRDLRPVKGNILGDLYSKIMLDENKEIDQKKKLNLLEKVTDVLNDSDWQNFIDDGNQNILEHLENLSYLDEEKRQTVKIGFAPFDFEDFVQNLLIQLPVYHNELIDEDNNNQRYFEISQNGLGYNNLIYTAAILGDIKQRQKISKEEFNLLLIEEPEAHLHPQLQNIFFNYLKHLKENNDLQIIVTSHSPTIAAKTDLRLLTILQNSQNKICSTQIRDIELSEESLKFLQKFLDVTKSQLFFANGVILVEGISEALLIPIFSQIIGKSYNIERNGVEVVNINGVAFKHFAKLFNSQEGEIIECRCAIITDDDKGKEGAEKRVEKVLALEGRNLKTKIGKKTFEYELFINNPENECLLKIIEKLHPRNFREINDSNRPINERADKLVTTLSNSSNKSEFAYLLAIALENDQNLCNFKVPSYIEDAIKFVIDGD